jgi:hypothetical protein
VEISDEQITWAARYVLDRLSDTVSMRDTAMAELEVIASPLENVQHAVRSISVQSEGSRLRVTRSQIDAAHRMIPNLRAALSLWSEEASIERDDQ